MRGCIGCLEPVDCMRFLGVWWAICVRAYLLCPGVLGIGVKGLGELLSNAPNFQSACPIGVYKAPSGSQYYPTSHYRVRS